MHVTYSLAVLHVLAKHANINEHGNQINLFSIVRIINFKNKNVIFIFKVLVKIINKY